MEIVETEQSRNVNLAANYNGLTGMSSYDLAPAGAGSKVTWTFGYETGSSPMKRWKGLVLDGLIGAEYRTGLEKLKAKIEGDRRSTARPTIVVPQAPVAPQGEEPATEGGGETVVQEAPAEGAAPAQTDAPPPPPRR